MPLVNEDSGKSTNISCGEYIVLIELDEMTIK